MSNIDQAFINAYTDHSPSIAQRVPIAAPAEAPPLRIFSHAVNRKPQELRIDQPVTNASVGHPPRFPEPRESAFVTVAAQQQSEFLDDEELTLPSLVGERKPLSAFATPRPAPSAAFKPVFEVDEFRWPLVTEALLHTSADLLLPVVESLGAASREGRSLVGIAGTNSGVGATTVTLCLARLIAEQAMSVAVVDGNFSSGCLASTLGLEFDSGWEQVLLGQVPLAECAVQSIADKITLIPLGGSAFRASERLSSIQSSVIAGMLRYHHELVLFDLGAVSDARQLPAVQSIVDNCRLDVGIIVAPGGAQDVGTLRAIDQLNAVFGSHCLGVISNRAS